MAGKMCLKCFEPSLNGKIVVIESVKGEVLSDQMLCFFQELLLLDSSPATTEATTYKNSLLLNENPTTGVKYKD